MNSRQQRIGGFLTLVSYLLTSSPPTAGLDLRLAGFGATRCSGRLEIFYNNSWGTVCDDGWDIKDARVVCRQLACGAAVRATKAARFGLGTGPIWLDDVKCSGREKSLDDCKHKQFGKHNCKHSKDAGVVCASIRLIGSTRCSGRVEVFHRDLWGTVCDDRWDLSDAMVVCRQLGCGIARGAAHSALFGEGDRVIWLDEVNCSGNENDITSCRHNGFRVHDCSSREDAGVVCSDSLPKSSISVDPSNPVYLGQTVSISCSDSAVLSGGTFFLKKTRLHNVTEILSSSSSTFIIPDVGFDDDGSYQCHYEITLSNQTFTTLPSDPVRLSVTGLFPSPDISMHPASNITLGQEVNITCAIATHIRLLGGVFIMVKSSESVFQQEISTSNSTTFRIAKVTADDEGRYQCVYKLRTSLSTPSAFVTLSLVSAVSSVASPGASLLVLRISAAILPLLLLLLLLAVILLVYRRKRRTTQSGGLILSQLSAAAKKDDKDHNYVNLHQRSINKELRERDGGVEEKETDVYEQPDEDHYYDDVGRHSNVPESHRKDEEEENPYISF
ncbi:deleted in malignant brain tumors 1 protein-like [Solea senegalensis]|uniref:Deleted in malignant brain tumors 1 protein-like n=1 Tax=Solea senegalensis TaxID=28829 RepID=A0AAV6RIL9_SOLSE|nr:deleted in malignant brain tumors 1 protein-like isoform X1 [Solea senegalensis]KAG7504974.1 deleted in malignant brain tumors 1 protein-like [Solea senegalensis]